MSNVISFPQNHATEAVQQPAYSSGPKTLFIHIRNTTMIVHLAAQRRTPPADGRIGTS